MDPKDVETYFFQLVLGLQQSGWMLLGKVANPMTGQMEKNLIAAKSTIDTMVMLREKTKGNLTKEEEELLGGAISQLEVNYVTEVENDKKETPEKPAQEENVQGTSEEKKD